MTMKEHGSKYEQFVASLTEHYQKPANRTFVRVSEDIVQLYRDNPNNHVEFYAAVNKVFGPQLGAIIVFSLTHSDVEAGIFKGVSEGMIRNDNALSAYRTAKYRIDPRTPEEVRQMVENEEASAGD